MKILIKIAAMVLSLLLTAGPVLAESCSRC